MIDVSIIIISFNTKDLTVACLESIQKTVGENVSHEVIVVDNASRDGSVERIKDQKSKIKNLKIIENKQNLGFSKANNIGVKEAIGRYILFLNSDTIVHENSVERIVEFMNQNEKAGAATCRVDLSNGLLDDASHRGFPTPWNSFAHFSGLSKLFPKSRLFSGYSLGWKDFKTTHEIDALAGAFMVVRKTAGDEVGWWDEDYFWYGEDIDFCYRLKQKGWKIYFVPAVSILHYKGASGGIKKESASVSTADEKTKQNATKARFEAMRIFYKKHYVKKYPSFVTWLILKGIDLKETLSS